MSQPAITLVTPTLNTGASLRRALSSLAAQQIDYESIVVDGGSSDDTAHVARGQAGTRLIEAPGSSIYEALNLGIAAAQAHVIGFLNADDVILEGALPAMLAALAANPAAEIVRGRPEFVEMGDGTELHDLRSEARATAPLSLETVLKGPAAINSMCFRRGLFQRIGGFDSRLRVAADREWLLRAWRAGAGIAEVAAPVYRYYMHPGSTTLDPGRRNYRAIRREHLAIVERVLAGPAVDGPLSLALRRWHAREVTLLVLDLAAAAEWRAAMDVLRRAFARAPAWPFDFAADTLAWSVERRRSRLRKDTEIS